MFIIVYYIVYFGCVLFLLVCLFVVFCICFGRNVYFMCLVLVIFVSLFFFLFNFVVIVAVDSLFVFEIEGQLYFASYIMYLYRLSRSIYSFLYWLLCSAPKYIMLKGQIKKGYKMDMTIPILSICMAILCVAIHKYSTDLSTLWCWDSLELDAWCWISYWRSCGNL